MGSLKLFIYIHILKIQAAGASFNSQCERPHAGSFVYIGAGTPFSVLSPKAYITGTPMKKDKLKSSAVET